MTLLLIPLLVLLGQLPTVNALVPAFSKWKYLDDGSNQGTAWRLPAFDDTLWPEDRSRFGYGGDGESTEISYGPDDSDKHITYYFRRTFNVFNPSLYTHVNLRLQRDDGAIVYLNGAEIKRSNMPASGVDFETEANNAIAAAGEANFSWSAIDPALLLQGQNVLAVEVHQVSPTSSDLSFNLELLASDANMVTRGPYLQSQTTTSTHIRWRTDLDTDARVLYGLAPDQLTESVISTDVGVHHDVELTGLMPSTRYYYSVGTTTQELIGADSDHHFDTSPPTGESHPIRIWAIGDSGTANGASLSVRDAYRSTFGYEGTDLLLMLGDNAYNDGTRAEYQAAVFDMFPELLRQTPVWPTRGNHEKSEVVYQELFTLPTLGQAGGMPSGTEAYYSFDHGNIHFICLDSEGSNRTAGGAMATWLASDLACTDQEWIIAFWHHPPYTKGSHDSDDESKLIEMRQNFLPILEAGGVDLVLSGHSHSYERSFLLNGHHGHSSTLLPSMILDDGDGSESGDGAYRKVPGPEGGTVYCVAGSSGKLSNGDLDHPVMFHSVVVLGSLVLKVEGRRLDLIFLDSSGQVEDRMTLAHQRWLHIDHGPDNMQMDSPLLAGSGSFLPGEEFSLELSRALPRSRALLVTGFDEINAPFQGGTLVPYPELILPFRTDENGQLQVEGVWPLDLPLSASVYFQFWVSQETGRGRMSSSNAIVVNP